MPEKSGCLSEAQLIFQHNTTHTRPTCVSLLVLLFPFSWPGGQVMSLVRTEGKARRERERWSIKLSRRPLNDASIVLTVNIGGGRGNHAMPVGNYSISAHRVPRL